MMHQHLTVGFLLLSIAACGGGEMAAPQQSAQAELQSAAAAGEQINPVGGVHEQVSPFSAPSPAIGKLFVGHKNLGAGHSDWEGYLEVINPQTLAVERTVQWDQPVTKMLVTSDGTKIYTFSSQDSIIREITLNADGTSAIAPIGPFAFSPQSAVFSRDGQFIFVQSDTGSTYKVDRSTRTIVRVREAAGHYNSSNLQESPTANLLVYSDQTNRITFLNSDTLVSEGTLNLGRAGLGMAFNSTGSELYVLTRSATQNLQVDIVAMNTRSKVASIALPAALTFCQEIQISRDDRFLYVAGGLSNAQGEFGSNPGGDLGWRLYAIDLGIRQVVVEGTIPHFAQDIELSPNGQTLYATTLGGGFAGLMEFNAQDLTLARSTTLGLPMAAQWFYDIEYSLADGEAPNPSECRADFNRSGQVSQQDLFDFLEAYHANRTDADFSGDGQIGVQDIFDFLAVYNQGCP